MQQVIVAIGLISSLGGLALIMRFGFRLQTRIEFGSTMPATDLASIQDLREHSDDVKGRLGFLLILAGILLQAGGSYCVWIAR